jgi:cell division protein FtsI/penicillin-binding protein 2
VESVIYWVDKVMQSIPTPSLQQDMLRRRMPIVVGVVVIITGVLLLRVISFQFPQDPRVLREFAAQRSAIYGSVETFESDRGIIYDRDGEPLAVNTREYRVGISPNLISNPQQTANDLARILGLDSSELLNLYNLLRGDDPYVLLGIVNPEQWQQINDLNLGFALDVDRIQRRYYPQGTLAAHLIGFMAGEGEDYRGYFGVEGFYQNELAGEVRDVEVSAIPFGLPEDPDVLGQGADIVLTIDRDVQFLVERELQLAITETGAIGGTIIVMNPRNGDILAMAGWPTFNPNDREFLSNPANQEILRNPAISEVFEPGSVFKVFTVASALEVGTIGPDWTYNDTGLFVAGGYDVFNWDRGSYGLTDVTSVLVNSLNVGAATISRDLGTDSFYDMVGRFGIGRRTTVDLQGEEAGVLRTPFNSEWSESDLATNSFGQGLSATPLQILTAINAIANDGFMSQPRVAYQVIDGDQIYEAASVSGTAILSPETANQVTQMMVQVVNQGLDDRARLPGYTVAGKTGTAEIAGPIGYRSDAWNMSFAGFLPADDPQVSVYILLLEPTSGRWASEVAAPVFARLAEQLVIMLDIPPDDVRLALQAEAP